MMIENLVKQQRKFYNKGKTRNYSFRMEALNRLEKSVLKHEKAIAKALKADLNKSSFETYMTETGILLNEIRYVKKHLKYWMKAEYVKTPLAQFPSRCFQIKEPYGVVLVMAPWNYPLMLSLEPVVGAIAAGNCCVIKPSDASPAVTKVLCSIIEEAFPSHYVTVVPGGRRENKDLLDQTFDYIFFTGGVTVGKYVMEKAARNLTPVTLELGGKSPCILDDTADIHLAAKRIVFGKYLNCGQTCVAPDYILVNQNVEKQLIADLKYWIQKLIGKNPLANDDYPCMINSKHYNRVMELMESGFVEEGGYGDPVTRKIAPTILSHVEKDSPVMQEEIFGPILPVLSYAHIKEAKDYITSQPKPLALYLFSKNPKLEKDILRNISFGGGCINDTIVHLATSNMGFGGVGQSGMGSYHGKDSFETFSHRKSILKKSFRVDFPIRYMPYDKGKERLMRFLIKY